MNILITAFEPFGNESINSSLELLNTLPDEYENIRIHKLVLPVVFNDCILPVSEFLANNQVDYIISLGQSALADRLNVERVAINLSDASIDDNAGNRPIDELIIINGENALLSTMPTRQMVEASNKDNIPARLSYSAGTFVCNNLMYNLLHLTKNSQTTACFIHVPLCEKQKIEGYKSMPTQEAKESLMLMIGSLQTDINP